MTAPTATASPTRRWWILAGSSVGLFMLMLDSTAVALALPTIRLDLGASSSGLQWVQNVYLLALAALVVVLGRVGDVLGRRLVFVAGLAVFAAGSAISAAASPIAWLVAGRATQGVGAAAMLALSLAIATGAFPTEERSRAVGIWAAVSSLALAIGPAFGGAVVDGASAGAHAPRCHLPLQARSPGAAGVRDRPWAGLRAYVRRRDGGAACG